MGRKVSKLVVSVILTVLVFAFVLVVFKSNFYVYVYDEQTKAFFNMSHNDIETRFNAQCVGEPVTGGTGCFVFEPVIAFPGFVTVNVEGYEPKTVFSFLGFNNKIKIYMKRSQ